MVKRAVRAADVPLRSTDSDALPMCASPSVAPLCHDRPMRNVHFNPWQRAAYERELWRLSRYAKGAPASAHVSGEAGAGVDSGEGEERPVES